MNNTVVDPSAFLEKIKSLLPDFKDCLRTNFKIVMIKIVDKDSTSEESSTSDLLFLEKSWIPEPKEMLWKISSKDELNALKVTLLKANNSFQTEFRDYANRAGDKLAPDVKSTFLMILRGLESGIKKLNRKINSFQVADHWGVEEMRSEFYFKVNQSLMRLIKDFLKSIRNGMTQNSAYSDLLNILNKKYLEPLNIFTYDIAQVSQTVDDEYLDFLEYQDCSLATTTDLKKVGTVKEIITYPYVIAYDSEKIPLVQGEVIVWKKEV